MLKKSIENNTIFQMRQIYVFFFVLTFTGCASSMKVTPIIRKLNYHTFHLNGIIRYDKNIQYLPRTIRSESVPNEVCSLILSYEYQVTYGRDYLFHSGELFPLFNPLTLIGAPIGEDNVYVMGKLDILQENKIIKSYKSVCTLEKIRNLFYQGETFSEMRKKGLISVRNNIETQMCQDKDFLINLTGQEQSH